MRFGIVSLIFLFILSLPPASADIIRLKGGGEARGQILAEDDDGIKLKVSIGTVTFKREEIDSIEYEETEIDHLRLGDDHLTARKFDKAIQEYQKVLQIDPQFAEASQKLKFAQDSKERAAQKREKKKKRLSELTRLGISYLEKGEYKKAIRQLEWARRISPRDGKIRANLAKAYQKLAELYIQKDDYDRAIKELKKAKRFAPKDNGIDRSLAGLYLKQAQVHFEGGSNDKALEKLTKAIKLNPEEPQAYILLGQIYDRREKLKEAMTAWKKALELDPENVQVKEFLDVVRLEKKTVKDLGLWKSEYFIIDFKGKDEEERKTVRWALKTLEEAYEAIGADLHYFPEKKTKVSFYAEKKYQKLPGTPDWSVGLYRHMTKDILISLPGILKGKRKMIKSVLWHETTHMFVHSLTGDNYCPTWLNEGLAKYEDSKIAKSISEGALKEAVAKKKLHSLKRLEGSFNDFKEKEAALAYAESYSLIDYIITEFGRGDLRRIFRKLSRGKSIEEALRLVLDTEYKDFEKNWRSYLKKKYSGK